MKRVFIILCCLAGIAGIYPVRSETHKEADTKSKKIHLKGALGGTGTMKAPAILPVEAYQNDTNIEVCFNRDMGYQNVVVTNQWGFPVFQRTVNATPGSRLVIPTQNLASGVYTIKIIGQNSIYEGQFEI